MNIMTHRFRSYVLQVNVYLLMVLLISLWGCERQISSPQSETSEDMQPRAIRVAAVQMRDMHHAVHYVGTISAERQLTLRAPIAGTLDNHHLLEGDFFKADENLVQLIAPEVNARVDQTMAETRRTEIERQFLCDKFEIDQALYKDGVLASAQRDISQKGCTVAVEAERAARAKLKEARITEARTMIKAPAAGQVLKWMAEPGEYIGPGHPIALLATGNRNLVVEVVEPDIGQGIVVGTKVMIRIADTTYESVVQSVAPMATGRARASKVDIALPEPLSDRRIGSSADIYFILKEETQAIVVPQDAIHQEGDKFIVFYIDDASAYRLEVTPGLRSSGFVEISPSPPPNSWVAVNHVDILVDGQPIYPVEMPINSSSPTGGMP